MMKIRHFFILIFLLNIQLLTCSEPSEKKCFKCQNDVRTSSKVIDGKVYCFFCYREIEDESNKLKVFNDPKSWEKKVEYFSNGKIKELYFVPGKRSPFGCAGRIGDTTKYFQNGEIRSKTFYYFGVTDGDHYSYWTNGNLQAYESQDRKTKNRKKGVWIYKSFNGEKSYQIDYSKEPPRESGDVEVYKQYNKIISLTREYVHYNDRFDSIKIFTNFITSPENLEDIAVLVSPGGNVQLEEVGGEHGYNADPKNTFYNHIIFFNPGSKTLKLHYKEWNKQSREPLFETIQFKKGNFYFIKGTTAQSLLSPMEMSKLRFKPGDSVSDFSTLQYTWHPEITVLTRDQLTGWDFLESILKKTEQHLSHIKNIPVFMTALKNNDLKTIQSFLKTNRVDIYFVDDSGDSFLHHAVRNNQVEIVKALFEAGCPTYIENHSKDPIHIAIEGKAYEILDIIMTKDNSSIGNRMVDHYFSLALEKKDENVIKRLIENWPELKSFSKNSKPLLCLAAEENDLVMLKLLMESGFDPNMKDYDGNSPLYFAYKNNNQSIIQELIHAGSEVNFCIDEKANSPLHIEVNNQNKEGSALLLKAKADVNSKNNEGNTPLHLAVKLNNIELIKLLLEFGADPKIKNNQKITAIKLAKNMKNKQIILLLKS